METVSMLEIKARPGSSVRLMHIREVIGRVVSLLNAADRELGQTQEAAKSSIARAASILIAEIGQSVETPPRTDGAAPLLRWQVSRVTEYIETNISQAIRVSDLSAVVSRTEAHFSRAFKRSFGLTPHAYVLRRRIEPRASPTSNTMRHASMPLRSIRHSIGRTSAVRMSAGARVHQPTSASQSNSRAV